MPGPALSCILFFEFSRVGQERTHTFSKFTVCQIFYERRLKNMQVNIVQKQNLSKIPQRIAKHNHIYGKSNYRMNV